MHCLYLCIGVVGPSIYCSHGFCLCIIEKGNTYEYEYWYFRHFIAIIKEIYKEELIYQNTPMQPFTQKNKSSKKALDIIFDAGQRPCLGVIRTCEPCDCTISFTTELHP